jgi:hypothetical protein
MKIKKNTFSTLILELFCQSMPIVGIEKSKKSNNRLPLIWSCFICLPVCIPSGKDCAPTLRDADKDVAVEVDGQDTQVQQGYGLRVVQTIIHSCNKQFSIK